MKANDVMISNILRHIRERTGLNLKIDVQHVGNGHPSNYQIVVKEDMGEGVKYVIGRVSQGAGNIYDVLKAINDILALLQHEPYLRQFLQLQQQ